MPRYLFGDFDHRAVVGAFRPDPETMRVEDPQAKYALDDAGWPTSASYDLGDRQYEFHGPVEARMTQFSAARGPQYRAQTGRTHRVGDGRTIAAGHTWLETFRDRIQAEGLG